MSDTTYPIRLHLRGRDVLVVGAGKVATRKVERLLSAGANVSVIAPDFSTRILELSKNGRIHGEQRAASLRDVGNVFMLIAATDDPRLNAELLEHARAQNILTLSVDAPETGDFSVPASVDSALIEATISTRGKAPAASRRLRRELAAWLREGPERFVREMTLARERLRDDPDAADRLRELSDGELFQACVHNDEARISALTSAIGSER